MFQKPTPEQLGLSLEEAEEFWKIQHHVCHVGLKDSFESGDKSMLLLTVVLCLQAGLPVPNWAIKALVQAYNDVKGYKHASWDSVFGRPHPKGAKLQALQKHREIAAAIWERVRERQAAGEPTKWDLFDEVGEEFDVSATVAKDIYYQSNHYAIAIAVEIMKAAESAGGTPPPEVIRQIIFSAGEKERQPKRRRRNSGQSRK